MEERMKKREEIEKIAKRETELLSGDDKFAIYQLKEYLPIWHDIAYAGYDFLTKYGYTPSKEFYDMTYIGKFDGNEEIDKVLSGIFLRFNTRLPYDYYGHSLSVSDVIVIRNNGKLKSYYVDKIGFKEFDYFTKELLKEKTHNVHKNYVADFRKRTEKYYHPINGLSANYIEQTVKYFVSCFFEDYGFDARVIDAVLSGSRSRGLENKDSDIDILLEYEGSEREDDVFTALSKNAISIEGIKVDINPVNYEQSGDLSYNLFKAERYLAKKESSVLEKLKEKQKEIKPNDKKKVTNNLYMPIHLGNMNEAWVRALQVIIIRHLILKN